VVDGRGAHADPDFARPCLWVRSVAVDKYLWAPGSMIYMAFTSWSSLCRSTVQCFLRSRVEGLFLARL
jgi:hypothetical protein